MANPVIYSLSCPITKDVMYIGRTIRPRDRIMCHLSTAKTGRCKNKKLAEWIMSLLDKGLLPIFTVLKECDRQDLSYYETEFINQYLPLGKIVNIASTSILHNQIDYKRLRKIVKSKKVRYQKIAKDLNFGYYSVAGYLIGQRCELSLIKAKRLEAYILSL